MKTYQLIQKIHKLSSEYIKLDTDDLANAGAFSSLEDKIED